MNEKDYFRDETLKLIQIKVLMRAYIEVQHKFIKWMLLPYIENESLANKEYIEKLSSLRKTLEALGETGIGE